MSEIKAIFSFYSRVTYLWPAVQKIFASILILAMLGQTFNQGWCYLGYLVEKKEYMARCENKARPQLHCDGKCQLMKKIIEQEKKERGEAPELKMTAKGDILSSGSYFTTQCFLSGSVKSSMFPPTIIGTPVDRTFSLFHPPDAA